MSKKTTYIIFSIIIILALFCAYDLFSRKPSDNVANTIQSISDDNKRAGTEVNNARQQITDASANATRIIERVERSETIVNQNAGTITECRELTKQCLELNRQAKSILADVDKRNQSGTQKSGNR